MAADRDPDAVCGAPTQGGSGPPCNAWAANGTGRCTVHGGATPAARDKAIVAKATEQLGLPAVRVRDYPTMVGEHIATINDGIDRMNAELEKHLLLDMTEVQIRREYSDIFHERRAELAVIALLAKSVASLSAAKAANTAADAGAEFLRSQSFGAVLAAVNDALVDYPEARAVLADRLMALVEGGA